ncbi:MAG: cation-translocating P-type ATPase [Planctomycetota bacterium]
MSELASPASAQASAQLNQSLDVPLTVSERARIVIQLGSALFASGLLAVGLIERHFGPPELNNIAELIMGMAACVVAIPIFWHALLGLFSQDSHAIIDQLVSLATLAALATGDFVTATLIPVIMALGHFLEERSILGAQAAIEGLRTLHAHKAMVLTPDGEREVEPSQLKKGDLVIVRPGDVIAADGQISEGLSAVDQSSITGESVPEEVGPGDNVYAGTVNLTGLIRVEVTRIGSQTALGRVVELLREAEQSKTPVLKLIEQYAAYYVPIILTIAGVVLFVTRDMSRAVAVLIVGCPGALVLAGPTAMIAALAAASRLGILIKNTRFLEALADVDTVVLDKTGTVTLGRLELLATQPMNGHAEDELLRQAVSCAVGSRHPVSRAIVRAAELAGIGTELDHAGERIEEVSGKGIIATTNGETKLLGRREWLIEKGVELPENPDHSGPIVWLGRIDQGEGGRKCQAVGCLLLADTPRPEAKQAIADLKALGLRRSVLLTGDRKEVAQLIGTAMEMDEIIAEVLPEQKLQTVRAEQEAGNLVMVVGDGVNDALALASGDVGVALGAVASDVALQSADVALMTNDLGRLPMCVRLARRTRAAIHENVLIGAGTSIAFMGLASLGIISPLAGAGLHVFGELFVIGNSARLLRFDQNTH